MNKMIIGLIFVLIPLALAVETGIIDDDVGINLVKTPNVSNYNVSSAEIWITDEGVLDDVVDISHSWLSDLGWSVSGHFMDTFLDMAGFSIFNVANLNVSGNASFTGPFDTTCLHCEDGDTYFHGDGFFSGNVTAPNIEVMESLIVHGNSTCTGIATACGDIADIWLCGITDERKQRGCHWEWGTGCVGTATPCEEMPTSICEEQHICSLTSDYGFVFDPSGFSGNFSIDTTGNITATNITADELYVNGVEITGTGRAIVLKNNSLASGSTYLLTNTTWNSINSVINSIRITTECENMNMSICTDSGCTSEDVIYAERYKNASTYGSYTYMNADSKAGVYMKYNCNSGAETSDIYLGGVTA